MSAIRQQFQLVAGATAPAPEAAPRVEATNTLPLLATAADVRGVVQYLRKKPGGVTINEAVDAIKKQVFDPRKVLAYEALGLVERQSERLKLSALGHELGRKLQPVAQVFRTLLNGQAPYRDVLAWAARQDMDVIVQADAARFWQERHPQALAAHDEHAVEASVVCFFQLCQAAALGTVIIGKKGQPTRLRVEREELLAYLDTEPAPAPEQATTDEQVAPLERAARRPQRTAEADELRILVARGRDAVLGEQVCAAFDLADIESRIVERSTAPRTLPDDTTLAAMHECNAALVIITRQDCQPNDAGKHLLREQLRIEIGALFTLYRGRVVCLWERGVAPPAELQPLSAGTFDPRAELPWADVLRLVRAVKQFRRAGAHTTDA
jgi:hypothetical protein